MRICAYSFPVSGSLDRNLETIQRAAERGAALGVSLLLFPECALTGYPPRDMESPARVDFDRLASACRDLEALSREKEICLVVGSVTKEDGAYHNSALIFLPGRRPAIYHKRALWGWDRDHFRPGGETGIFGWQGLKIGVRICYEVRFPEFFRELYRAGTDLNLLLFYDVADRDDPERYALLRAHIQTRAVENVTYFLSANATAPFQTAPAMLCGRSGQVLAEGTRNRENLLTYDLDLPPLDFGEEGRVWISDRLNGRL